jgi:tRNA-splicing ligase RtcB
MKTITSERLPLKIWADDLEAGALAQAKNLANLSIAFHHIAIMPDAHQGYGMPIGGVMATQDAVVPNAVGVDIGCGMCAVKTSLTQTDPTRLKQVLSIVREKVPLGFNHHRNPQEWEGFNDAPDLPVIRQELSSARRQLGSLGGGNHFIEIQQARDGFIWLMLHSGSRNFGLKIANTYHQKARAFCEREGVKLPDKDLSFLPLPSPQADEYLAAMNFALRFALESRTRMLRVMMRAVDQVFGTVEFGETVNIHHNYAQMEHHFGQEVMVHRKGATAAREGQRGIIPGSQGTPSYIVIGRGNPESFCSCSHGAGRRMGRKQAQRSLDLDKEVSRLEKAGVIHAIRNRRDLDEAAGAYKDIDAVMRQQKDLVRIEVALKPLAVIKG